MSEQASGAPQAQPSQVSEQSPQQSQVDSQEGQASQEAVAALEDQAQNGTPSEKKEAKKMLNRLKLKVDGREIEEELPFEIPDDENAKEWMIRQLQMGRMGTKRAQEYAGLEKEVRTFIERLRKDPMSALQDPMIGVDVKKLAAAVIEKEVEDSQKSPEQLEIERIQAELKKERDERQKEKTQREEQEKRLIEEREFERIDREMSTALEESGLPTDESAAYFVKKMADYMMLGIQNGIDVRPQDVLPIVRKEFESDMQSFIKSLPPDQVEKLIGKEVFNQIRKKNVAKAKAPTPVNKITDTGVKKQEEKEVKKQTFKQFFGV